MSEIDVTKCTMYKDGNCFDGMICIGNTDGSCIYVLEQQLQQLKAENEKLKKLNEQLATYYYPEEKDELLNVKQENEELKDKIFMLKEFISDDS